MTFSTLPEIHKKAGTYLSGLMEADPIVFNGELCTVTSVRSGSTGTEIVVHNLFTKQERARKAFAYGLVCALVDNGVLYVFGTSNWSAAGNHVAMISTTDLVNWTSPITVFNTHVSGQTIFNTSIDKTPTGYVMAYEVSEPGLVDFSIRTATSTNLLSWTPVGVVVHPQSYAACPCIKYLNGWYYIVYLRNVDGGFVSFIMRTNDFITYDYFNGNAKWPDYIQFLSHVSFPTEGNNNSDVGMIEHNGITYITYAVGDQQTWANVRTAVYLGTLEQLFKEFWP